MNIALIAHNSKKELLLEFCLAYQGAFSKHTLCATDATGNFISKHTGLNISCYLGGQNGGYEQIASRISCREIQLVLFFRDPIGHNSFDYNESNLLRLCDVSNIPVATNIATAEPLIMALDHGDLEWSNYGNPLDP